MNEYSYLWDGASTSWALVHLNAENVDEVPRYLIFNVETRRALLISDDVICEEVKQAMIDHSVRIIRSDSL